MLTGRDSKTFQLNGLFASVFFRHLYFYNLFLYSLFYLSIVDGMSFQLIYMQTF